MSEVIIFFLNNVTVILISLILLSNFFVVFSCQRQPKTRKKPNSSVRRGIGSSIFSKEIQIINSISSTLI